jgi:hypothetical protein
MTVEEVATLPALSPEWRRRVVSKAGGLVFGDATVVMQLIVDRGLPDERRYFQVFEDGSLVAWEEGTAPEATVALVQRAGDAESYAEGRLFGNGALVRSSVVQNWEGVEVEMPVPPFDRSFLDPPLAPVPGASMTVQQQETESPFGTVSFYERFRDGCRSEWSLGSADEAEVSITRRYGAVGEWLGGGMPLLNSYEGGDLYGGWTYFMLQGGLMETEEYRTTRSVDTRTVAVLALFGGLVSSPIYRSLLGEVAGVQFRGDE